MFKIKIKKCLKKELRGEACGNLILFCAVTQCVCHCTDPTGSCWSMQVDTRLTVLSIVDRPMSSFSFSLFFLSAIFSKSFERKANAFILHGVKLVTVNI